MLASLANNRFMRIAVLSNPTSHSNKAAMPVVRELMHTRSDVIHHEIQSIAEVPDRLHEWADENLDLLVVNGGDGTIQAVMTDIIHHDPFHKQMPLAVVPGGKTNMFAMDLGGKGKPQEIMHRILTIADAGDFSSRVIDHPLVGLKRTPDSQTIYGTFFGTAAVVRGIEYCRAKVYPLGLPNIVSHVAACSIIIGGSLTTKHGPDSPFRPEDISITLDDADRTSGRYFLITVTSLGRLVLGMRPFSSQGEGQLHFLSVDYSPGTIFKASAKAFLARPKEFACSGTVSRNVSKVSLELDCPVTLDGEFFQPEPGVPVELLGDRSLPFLRLS